MQQLPKETQSDPEVTIERTVEELEQKIAPASVEKIAINHNETLVRDKDEKTIDHGRRTRREDCSGNCRKNHTESQRKPGS